MWWYRDTKKSPAAQRPDAKRAKGPASAPAPAAPSPGAAAPTPTLAGAVAAALAGRPRDPDAWLAMSVLVDSRIELSDGTTTDGMTWHEAEREVATALSGGDPVRLYNRFARDFGEGYSRREDAPAEHRESLARLREALAAAPGVKSVGDRSPRDAEAAPR